MLNRDRVRELDKICDPATGGNADDNENVCTLH